MESLHTQEASGNLPAFLAGALIGAGVALLFTPQAGSQVRGLIREYASQAMDELNGVIERGAEGLETATEQGQDFVEQGKESLRDTTRKAGAYAGAKG